MLEPRQVGERVVVSLADPLGLQVYTRLGLTLTGVQPANPNPSPGPSPSPSPSPSPNPNPNPTPTPNPTANQVMDEKFLAPYKAVVRWFTTCVTQPEFLAVLGPTKLCGQAG